jgi:peroxiredoxin Q/BCP
VVFGVNERTQEANREWVEKEGLPFSVLLDPDRAIAQAYDMSKEGDERYLANPSGGRRPAVIIDEEGIVLKLLPDLSSVDEQMETLNSL